ncbi:MAG TPA: hypothetical protein DER01_03210 [Phycisphaerales bacterium]|nr:hypothetical protein [Phycisphaerales bacterium]|tara:strand:- start:476 stop:667 length:192 start_codon:yes stop_codon:yes gene_type:complete
MIVGNFSKKSRQDVLNVNLLEHTAFLRKSKYALHVTDYDQLKLEDIFPIKNPTFDHAGFYTSN